MGYTLFEGWETLIELQDFLVVEDNARQIRVQPFDDFLRLYEATVELFVCGLEFFVVVVLCLVTPWRWWAELSF